MKELQLAINELRKMDENYEFVTMFLAKPQEHFKLIEQVLQKQTASLVDMRKPFTSLMERYDQIMHRINDNWWPHTYRVHDHHFHKSFENYCNCQFTCLTEIIDCLDKIIQGA